MKRDRKQEIKDLFSDCRIKGGKGNVGKANLMIAYEGPRFKSKKMLKQIAGELKISNKEIYATPFIKDDKKTKEELFNLFKAEIAIVSPRVIWTIGKGILKDLNIKMPISYGYGQYFPFLNGDFFIHIMPTAKMINKMPDNIKETFWDRMKNFKKEWFEFKKTKDFSVPKNRRSDANLIKGFAEKNDYKFDRKLESPKSYFITYSNKISDHIIITTTRKAKKDFKKNIPFGIKFTQSDLKGVDKERANRIAKVLKAFDGELIDADISVIKEAQKKEKRQ